ncbi:MAG: carbohydrate-binding family 9-like protein, partial [Phycisphaerales bacterium]|nr:carbohydrate-binding family 9-like protein [Phycisphaerales bacterium]
DFVDIEGDLKPRPRLRTRAKMLWDDTCFYVFAEMHEPHVWATLTERDSVIFHDNDFEVFLNPEGGTTNYYELEVNALNTQWDLFLAKRYRDGGKADDGFNFKGLNTAVHVEGTLNAPSDSDTAWSIEIAIPWSSMDRHADPADAPDNGEVWLINFSRVQWDLEHDGVTYTKTPNRPEHNWVWSPMGLVDMHLPTRWGRVRFEHRLPDGTPSSRDE